DWVRQGGLLIFSEGMGKFRSVEGDEWPYTSIIGVNANRGKGRVLAFDGRGDSADYRAYLAQSLASAPELSPRSRAMVAADGEEDGLYVSLCAPDELLWLNTTDHEARKGGVAVPAHGMVEEKIR